MEIETKHSFFTKQKILTHLKFIFYSFALLEISKKTLDFSPGKKVLKVWNWQQISQNFSFSFFFSFFPKVIPDIKYWKSLVYYRDLKFVFPFFSLFFFYELNEVAARNIQMLFCICGSATGDTESTKRKYFSLILWASLCTIYLTFNESYLHRTKIHFLRKGHSESRF